MDLQMLIEPSRATQAFKCDVIRYMSGDSAVTIQVVRPSPRVKVIRLIAQLLSEEPSMEIEDIAVDAWSGCSDFWGHVAVTTPAVTTVFRFRWDCSWRAEQQGWYDPFQYPDQIRAAREFDWRCFAVWEQHLAATAVDSAPN